jgi:hypothetical protein
VRSGKVVRFEPQDLKLVNAYQTIIMSFQINECIRFYEKVTTTIAGITFQVLEKTILATIEIFMQGEKWFKGIPLDTACYIDFLKPEYRNQKISANIPSEYILEPFENLLRIIHKYFTCDGRFDKEN